MNITLFSLNVYLAMFLTLSAVVTSFFFLLAILPCFTYEVFFKNCFTLFAQCLTPLIFHALLIFGMHLLPLFIIREKKDEVYYKILTSSTPELTNLPKHEILRRLQMKDLSARQNDIINGEFRTNDLLHQFNIRIPCLT